MKNIVKMLLIIILITQVININNENVYAADEEVYYIYMTQNNELYDKEYPNWCGYFRYYDTAKIKVKWVCCFNANGKYFFPFYATENIEDLNFDVRVAGNHKRTSTALQIEDCSNLSESYKANSTITSSSNEIFIVTVSEKKYYCYVPDIMTAVDMGKEGDLTDYKTNIDSFNLYKNEKNVSFIEGYEQIVTDILNGKNYNGEAGGEFYIDANGNITSGSASEVIQDIPTPTGVKVLHTKDMDRWNFRINWDIPEMNGYKYYVEINVADYLKFKRFIYQDYHKFTVGWHRETEDAECYRGYYLYKIDEDIACLNGLANKWQEIYGGDKMTLSKAKFYFNAEGSLTSLGVSKHDFVQKWKYPGITIRFWYRDEEGRKHTSNYVQLTDIEECTGYVANELSKFEYLNDGNSGEVADNDNNVTQVEVDNTSGLYDGTSDVMNDNNEDIENKSAIETLKSMINDMKNYPDFFVEFFSFLPHEISDYIYALIVVMIPLVLLKIIRG